MIIRGMKLPCPSCGDDDTKVVETGWSTNHKGHTRKRECKICGAWFYTKEEYIEGTLIKRPKRKRGKQL